MDTMFRQILPETSQKPGLLLFTVKDTGKMWTVPGGISIVVNTTSIGDEVRKYYLLDNYQTIL